MIEQSKLEKMLATSRHEYVHAVIKNNENMKMFHAGRINILCKLMQLDEDDVFYSLINEAKNGGRVSS